MKCRSCNFEILPELKHAISQNVCPSCGGAILDEETLALIEDLEQTISAEVALREGTARKLATSIAFKYVISGVVNRSSQPKLRQQKLKEVVAEEVEESDIVNVSKMEGIDSKTREQLYEEVIRDKFEQAGVAPTEMGAGVIEEEDEHAAMANVLSQLGSQNKGFMSDSEMDGNPRLEQERLLRLAKQQAALKSGSGSVRRSG
jgi:G3E family GTPase